MIQNAAFQNFRAYIKQDVERSANKVTTIGASSTNETYPSAKAVWDLIMSMDGEEESY